MSKRKHVLICGAGPCGLTVASVLSQFNIRHTIIEKHPGTSTHPKARGVNVRTMEWMRLWGLEESIRAFELDSGSRRFLWMDKIQGKILGDVKLNESPFKYSPTVGCSVPQNHIEDAMCSSLMKSTACDLRFSVTLVDFEQKTDHVLCHLLDNETKTVERVEYQYLIAADGAHSPIRDKLNIKMEGVPSLGRYLTIYAHVDLSSWLKEKQAVVYSFTGKDQIGHFLMAVDHKDRWIFGHRLSDETTKVTDAYCRDVIRSFLSGNDIEIQIISHSIWDMAALNAQTYQRENIFLVGDAAHRMPPTGGMGMNTGIAGAQNLGWKLAYVLKSFAKPSLLTTYEKERKPIAAYTLGWSGHNAKRMFSMLSAYREGHIERFNELMDDQTHHLNHPGLDLGMIYESDAIYSTSDSTKQVEPSSYIPSSTPGMRAPHCDIILNGKTNSILTLYQKAYVLLLSENASINKEDLPIPAQYPVETYRHVKDFRDPNHDFIEYYNMDTYQAVLVRPDGHIAWRG